MLLVQLDCPSSVFTAQPAPLLSITFQCVLLYISLDIYSWNKTIYSKKCEVLSRKIWLTCSNRYIFFEWSWIVITHSMSNYNTLPEKIITLIEKYFFPILILLYCEQVYEYLVFLKAWSNNNIAECELTEGFLRYVDI